MMAILPALQQEAPAPLRRRVFLPLQQPCCERLGW